MRLVSGAAPGRPTPAIVTGVYTKVPTIRRRNVVVTLLLAVAGLGVGCTRPEGGKASDSTPTKLVFGFVPSVEADKIAENAQPMADFLTKELGMPVETYTTQDYAGLVEAMKSGQVDIGSLPPLAYVLAKDRGAADVMLKTSRRGSPTYHSFFTARAGSGITKIEDAKGKRIAFVDPSSASGFLFPAAYLKKQGIEPDSFFSQTVFAGGHDAAIRAVYTGEVDVAATYDDARNKLEKLDAYKDVKTKVVPIGKTDEIPNDTISVRAGLSADLVAKIKAAFLKYKDTPEGKKTLDDVYEVDDLLDATDADYDPVREVAQAMGVGLESFQKKKDAPKAAAPAKK
jgi:phosphonate transport system substrate-binding protein